MFSTHKFKIRGPKPAGLSISRDKAGVPHIQAASLDELTWGIGYCQAHDRGTQLQMMRVIGQGRLCELLEDSDDNFAIDCFFRRMNWYQNDAREMQKLTPETRDWCQALCDGINAGLSSKRWSALKLLGFKAEPWRIQDIFLTLRMTSYLTLAQSQAEVEKLFIELAQSGISSEKLAALFPVDADALDRDLLKKINLQDRIVPVDSLWQSAVPRAMASNNWVVSGKHTRSGAAMMANDPHLEVNRLPNVWYEMALSCPEYQGLGYGMPGLPGLLIGRTNDIAWGATYTFMDTVDSWVEHCRDGKYRRGKRWQAFDQRIELIKRKKHADQKVIFHENKHGVLDGNPEQEDYLLTTAWSPALFGARSLNANFELTQAKTVTDAMTALGKIESAWNWVISDKDDNIGYQMSGLCPKRHPQWNGFTPAPGWDKAFDWQGFEETASLPRSYNPECGFIVTANQDLNHLGTLSPINMPMGDYRAVRIEQLLKQSSGHTRQSMQAIQMDTCSLQAEQFLKTLLPAVQARTQEASAIDLLEKWDCHYDAESKGAVLFEQFYAALRAIVFGRGGLNAEAIEHLSRKSGLFIDFYQNFDDCLLDPASQWYDDINQQDAFCKAFEIAAAEYQGQEWGDQNRFRFTNILFQGKLPDWLGFDSPEVVMIGGRATPHQGQIYESAGRLTSFAPSVRIVADMSEKALYTCTAGGVSDNRLSSWYQSEISAWLKGSLKKLHH